MGYVFSFQDALHYKRWSQSEPGRSAIELEKELLQRIWSPLSAQRVLEVGCGTGIFLEWLSRMGHQVTGLDPSPEMLNIAREAVPPRVSLDRGFAENLPYPDNFFDTVALITTLEFVDDPLLALQEACRVARSHVLIGSLNRYSLLTWKHCLENLWKPSIYRHARFYSILGLRGLVESTLSGPVPLRWRTCLTLPPSALRYTRFVERCRYVQWNPFGHFIGMRVDMRYTVQAIHEPLLTKVLTAGPDRCQVVTWRTSRRPRKGKARSRQEQKNAPVSRNQHMGASTSQSL